MKIILLISFIGSFSLAAFPQTESEKTISLSPKKMKERVIKEEFFDVPQNVRDCHARGTFSIRLIVDEKGDVKNANLLSGICKNANEYVEKTVANWKFKPLEVDGKKISFKGVILIPFCYGGFSSWCHY